MKALVVSLESFQKGEVPPEVERYIASKGGNVFIILDESSKIKSNAPCKDSAKSKRTQAVMKLNCVGHRCILTGTFMSKTPVNAYDQMNFLRSKFFPESMYAFAERYEIRRPLPNVRGARITITQKDWDSIRSRLLRHASNPSALDGIMDGLHSYYGISREDCLHILKSREYNPFKNLDELWSRIGGVCMRVDRKSAGLPVTKVYGTKAVSLTKEQHRLYTQLQNLHCTDNIAVDNGLKLYLRFQDVCNGYEPVDKGEEIGADGKKHSIVELVPLKENPKLDMLEEAVEEIGGSQAVIWCSRTRLLYDAKARMESLGYTTAVYDGKVGKEEREEGYRKFARGEVQLIFINQASGAYGLDGLKEADYAFYLCSSYSVEQRAQSEERIHRGSVSRAKHIIDITCEGTCEDKVVRALKQGKELIDTGVCDSSVFKYFGREP